MSTKNRIFSKEHRLTEHRGKYGINDKDGKTVLYPVYDSVWELDSQDFIIENDGCFGYMSGEKELILPLYDVIIKKEHGLSLMNRENSKGDGGRIYSWYDTKSDKLYKNVMHVRTFVEYDLLVPIRNHGDGALPFLKKWGENVYIEVPFDICFDILYEIPMSELSYFFMVEECDSGEYEYSFLIVKQTGEFTFSACFKTKEALYEILPKLMEDIKCNSNVIWFSPRQK